jgi:hypothetical protein
LCGQFRLLLEICESGSYFGEAALWAAVELLGGPGTRPGAREGDGFGENLGLCGLFAGGLTGEESVRGNGVFLCMFFALFEEWESGNKCRWFLIMTNALFNFPLNSILNGI